MTIYQRRWLVWSSRESFENYYYYYLWNVDAVAVEDFDGSVTRSEAFDE